MGDRGRVHLEYAHSLDPNGWSQRHAQALVPDRLPYGLDRLEAFGWDVTVRPATNSAVLRSLDGVARKLTGGFNLIEGLRDRTRRQADLVLCWDERSGIPAALRTRLRGEPPVALGVIWLTERRPPIARRGRLFARAGLREASLVWAMSSAQLPILEADWGVPPDRLHLLRMGIDEEFWHEEGESEPGLVVAAGNDRHRDHQLLVQAVARVRKQDPSVRLELASHHPVEVPAELGRRHPSVSHTEMRTLYGRSSIVAIAVKHNFHLSGLTVLLEAMACARPVVVTQTAGVDEYIRHGEAGLLVPANDPEAMADAIEKLLADPERARALGKAGREAIMAKHTTRLQAAQLADIAAIALAK